MKRTLRALLCALALVLAAPRVDFDYLARTTRLALAVLADRAVD